MQKHKIPLPTCIMHRVTFVTVIILGRLTAKMGIKSRRTNRGKPRQKKKNQCMNGTISRRSPMAMTLLDGAAEFLRHSFRIACAVRVCATYTSFMHHACCKARERDSKTSQRRKKRKYCGANGEKSWSFQK